MQLRRERFIIPPPARTRFLPLLMFVFTGRGFYRATTSLKGDTRRGNVAPAD